MDVRAMSFPDQSFDICIDKCALDAMLRGSMWDPPDEVKKNGATYVGEVS